MSYEIGKMLQSAEDCLLSAEHSFKGGWYKAAANRSYYCVFDCITALLYAKGASAKTHQGAHVKFRQLYIKTALLRVNLDEILTRVFDLRQSSDYDFEFEPTKADTLSAIESAKEFLAATKSYLQM